MSNCIGYSMICTESAPRAAAQPWPGLHLTEIRSACGIQAIHLQVLMIHQVSSSFIKLHMLHQVSSSLICFVKFYQALSSSDDFERP